MADPLDFTAPPSANTPRARLSRGAARGAERAPRDTYDPAYVAPPIEAVTVFVADASPFKRRSGTHVPVSLSRVKFLERPQ